MTTIKLKVVDTYPDKHLPVYEFNYKLFMHWMAERHEIWYRRHVLKQDPPFTEDPILRQYKFTNVYRALDRNTAWFIWYIADSASVQPAVRTVLQTMIFRLINNPDTFMKAGLIDDPHDWSTYREHLRKVMNSMPNAFTNAYFIHPIIGKNRIDGYLDDVLTPIAQNVHSITTVVRQGTPEQMVAEFKKYTCIGDFIAYELYCDFVHTGLTGWGFDDFVNIGPGCWEGIRHIFPSTAESQDFKLMTEAVWRLKTTANWHIDKLGYNFKHIYPDRQFTLREIEHSLCEFGKYLNLHNKVGRFRLGFNDRSIDPEDWLQKFYDTHVQVYPYHV